MRLYKILRVGKRERYILGLAQWLDGEPLTSVYVEPDAMATLFGVPDIDGSDIGFFLDGAAIGTCQIHVNYATATRTDCRTLTVLVRAC